MLLLSGMTPSSQTFLASYIVNPTSLSGAVFRYRYTYMVESRVKNGLAISALPHYSRGCLRYQVMSLTLVPGDWLLWGLKVFYEGQALRARRCCRKLSDSIFFVILLYPTLTGWWNALPKEGPKEI